MQILFAISALCFLALLGAGFALARLVRAGRNKESRGDEPHPADGRDFAQHLFEAVANAEDTEEKDFSPRLRQTVRDVAARKSWNQGQELATALPTPQRVNPNTAEELLGGQRTLPRRF